MTSGLTTKHSGVKTSSGQPAKHTNKKRSLSELDDVVDEIIARAPPEWFSEIDKIIEERKNG
jgi:hypothetical protein